MIKNDNPFASEEITPPHSAEWEAKRRVAQAIKKLTEALVTSSPSVEEMQKIAKKLDAAAEDFNNTPRIFGRIHWTQSGEHGSFGQISHELNPLAGWSNPIAPPVKHWMKDQQAFGTCQCGWAYEGPPGSVHGGIVAAIFDQFLGMAQVIGGQPGMTAYLNMSYHNRTPLNTELKLEGQLLRIEGRKTFMRGEMFADGTMTASCEGLFVQPRGGMQNVKVLKAALAQATTEN